MELLACLTVALHKRLEDSVANGYDFANDEFDERKYVSNVASIDPQEVARPDVIRSFITKVFKEAEVGEEVIVMASVYLSRLTTCSPVRLAPTNWRLLILCCFMLASKVWEEEAVWNEDFLSLFPAIGVKRFAALELHMLNSMQFEVCVKVGGVSSPQFFLLFFLLPLTKKKKIILHTKASTYTQAYFELTSLSTQKRDWKKKPLTMDEARDLEIRTLNLETKSKASKETRPRRNSDATHDKVKEGTGFILG